jgi:uncharacterized protein (DUF1697 family)
MQTFISIVRGINVSGQKKILMADLKLLYDGLSFKNISTYIQSGNVIFSASTKLANQKLAEKIEEAISKKYNFKVPVIIRKIEEIESICRANPFLKNKAINTEKLHVTFLSEIPNKEDLKSVEKIDYSPDHFRIIGTEIFIYCPESYGETKVSNSFFRKN